MDQAPLLFATATRRSGPSVFAALSTAAASSDLSQPRDHGLSHSIHHLRKSVWPIINEGIANGADLSIISHGCRLQTDGCMQVYTHQTSTSGR